MRNLAKALVLLVLMAGLVSQSALASDNTIWDYLKEIDLSKDNEKFLSDYIEYKNEFLEEKKQSQTKLSRVGFLYLNGTPLPLKVS